MADTSFARSLVETIATAARENFIADGHLAPVAICYPADPEAGSVVFGLAITPDNGGAPKAMDAAITLGGIVMGCRYITLVSETWMRAYDEGERGPGGELPHIERGHLERLHDEGDAAVHTSLLVSLYDLEDIDASFTMMLDADDDFKRTEVEGAGEGAIADVAREAVGRMRIATALRPPDYKPRLSFIKNLIVQHQLGRWIMTLGGSESMIILDVDESDPDIEHMEVFPGGEP